MAITKENKEFISNLIDYYISTATSYKDLAEVYEKQKNAVADVTFGMIVGSVYSSFMQVYQNQQITPSLEDVKEFNGIIIEKSNDIKNAINNEGHPNKEGLSTKEVKN